MPEQEPVLPRGGRAPVPGAGRTDGRPGVEADEPGSSGAPAAAIPDDALAASFEALEEGPSSLAGPTPVRPGFRGALVAFESRNFTLFWFGALVSNTGNWVQNVTVQFVIYQITGSAAWLGLAAFLQFIPFVVTGPIGGALADRYHRRSILIVTQAAQAVAALALWVVWSAGVRSPLVIIAIVFVNGLIAGLNIPAWQAFVSELVPRRDLLNAVTLNSAQFNASRFFGPLVGGMVLALLGASWAFLLNALSFAAVIVALALISVPRLVKATGADRTGVISGFTESLRYSRRRPGIAVCLVVVAALGGLGSPMNQLIAVFADQVYGVGDFAYGVLGAAGGLGAIFGTPLIVGRGSRLSRSRLVGIAMVVYGGAVVAFGLAPVYALGVAMLLITGAGYLAIASTLNTTVQLQVDELMRGKVLALYVMVLTIALPIGGLAQGLLAQLIGPQAAVVLFGSGFLAVWAWLRFGGGDHLAAMDADPPLVR